MAIGYYVRGMVGGLQGDFGMAKVSAAALVALVALGGFFVWRSESRASKAEATAMAEAGAKDQAMKIRQADSSCGLAAMFIKEYDRNRVGRGMPPAKMEDLHKIAATYDDIRDDWAIDPWGTELRIDGKAAISAGPDTEFDTDDDIRRTAQMKISGKSDMLGDVRVGPRQAEYVNARVEHGHCIVGRRIEEERRLPADFLSNTGQGRVRFMAKVMVCMTAMVHIAVFDAEALTVSKVGDGRAQPEN